MIEIVCSIVMLMLIVAFGASFVRVVIGPSLPLSAALNAAIAAWTFAEREACVPPEAGSEYPAAAAASVWLTLGFTIS